MWPNNGTKFQILNFLMFLMSFLAVTHLIFNFLKHFSDLNLALNFQENDLKHQNKNEIFVAALR